MNDISLKLNERTVKGKKVARLRRNGWVPSVVYGGKTTPINTQSQLVETTKVTYAAGKHSPVHLTIDGKKKLAMIKSIDVDPVAHRVRHVAFHTVKQNEKIVAEVPIVLSGTGESLAEKAGLVVLQTLDKIEVRALPTDLPEALELSVLELETADDKLTLADAKLPDGVEFADVEQDTTLVIANVYEPSALQAANEAAGGEAELEEDEAVADVEAEHGANTPQQTGADETRPGGKEQKEPKQLNVDANK